MQVGQIGHAAGSQILLEALSRRRFRKYRAIQMDKFLKQKGIDDEFNVSSAQIGGQLTGQQFRIGAGDIDCLLYTSRCV